MGEIPKKEPKPLPNNQANNQEQKTEKPGLFNSPNSLSLILCASAAILIGGIVCYAMTRPAEMRLSDVTRSPLGFDVGDLENEETTEEEEPLLALGSSGPSSSSYSQPISPQAQPQSAPVHMPTRRPKPEQTHQTPQIPEKFEDPQLFDSDVDDSNTPHPLLVKGPEFYQRVTMLEQEIHQLRSVLVQRERMIAQLSRELTESRARPPIVAMETPEPTLEPIATQTRTHTVQKGDTLSEIAQRYYGTRTAWTKIYRANAEKVPDKNRLLVGVVLTIPE